jgi:hypothetical protein
MFLKDENDNLGDNSNNIKSGDNFIPKYYGLLTERGNQNFDEVFKLSHDFYIFFY